MRTIPWGFAVLAAAIVLSGSRSARAQEPTPSPAPSSTAAPAISEQAKRHFNAGVALLQDPEGEKVEEAYRQFKTAYDLSGSAKILGNMGFCAMRLERDGEAIDAYSRYLREVPDIDAEERAQIVRDLQTLTVGVARFTIEVNTPGATLMDERVPVRGARVTNTYGPVNGKMDVGVRPGHHIFTAKVAGREDATWELEAYAGSKEQHAFVLKEPATPVMPMAQRDEGKPSATGPILLIATGGAMLLGAGITGIIALNKSDDIADRCKNDVCPRGFDLDGERSSARTFVAVTDLLLVLGGLTVIGGLYWGYRVSSSSPEPKAAPAPAKAAHRFLSDWRLVF